MDTPGSGTEIITDRFHLKPLSGTEAPLLAELGADPDVVKTLVFDWSTPDKRLEIAKYWIEQNQEFGIWGVYDLHGIFGITGKMIGFCAAERPLPRTGKGPEIYYAFSRESWGKGVATEVVGKLISHLFSKFNVLAVEALVLSGLNMASNRLLEKLGMCLIGRYPFAEYIGDASDSTIAYEIWRVTNSSLSRAKQNLEEAAFKIGQFIGAGVVSESAMFESLAQASTYNGLVDREGTDSIGAFIEMAINAGKQENGWLYYRLERACFEF
jgi:RimJ/RimL family protein N-acetyltransferase